MALQCQAQHADHLRISEKNQRTWLKKTASLLKKMTPDTCSRVSEIKRYDFGDSKKVAFRIVEYGLIKLENGDWVYILTHSSHEDETVGDISMAISSDKKLYVNYGHVCGGIINFQAYDIQSLSSSEEFFRLCKSDTDGISWEPYKKR